jgi:nucleotide-binding universal stress UspA family protein
MAVQYAVRKILVPLDGSDYGERALSWAKAIAGDSAELILLEVVPAASEVRDFRGRVVSTVEQIAAGFNELATDQLNDVRTRWFPDRENIALVIAEGDPTEQILWASAQHNADLIVMSSHGRGAVGRFASGSVADRVMRHAPLPVMVIGPESAGEDLVSAARILAPVDGSPLSLSALPVAAGLSLATAAPVHAVNVITPALDEYPAAMSGLSAMPGYSEDIAQAQETQSRELIEEVIQHLESLGAEATGDVMTGSISSTLTALLQPGDILVIASHGRKGLPRWVLGSTAMKLIQNAAAPIVVVTREFAERPSE